MSDPNMMTPDELRNFEERELHHEDPAPAGPASESDEVQKGDRESPTLPLPNPD